MGSTVSYYWDNQEKFDKIKTVSGGDDEEIFSQSLLHQQYKKNMSDREIMDSKNPPNRTIRDFEKLYPELAEAFQVIQEEQYTLFASKMMDYGLNNISLGSDLSEKEDVDFSMMGIWLRCNDKVNRLKNLLKRKGNHYVPNEPMIDSFIDLSNYGIIAQLVIRGLWK